MHLFTWASLPIPTPSQSAYQQVDIPPRAYPSNYGLAIDHRTNAVFDGTTTNKEAYKAYPIEPRPAAGNRGYAPNSAPFEGNSEVSERMGQAQAGWVIGCRSVQASMTPE